MRRFLRDHLHDKRQVAAGSPARRPSPAGSQAIGASRVKTGPAAAAARVHDLWTTPHVHFIEGSPHAQGFMTAWLPRERLLVEADAYTPGPPHQPPPATPNALHVNLVSNVQRPGFGVDRIVPLHGRVVPFSEPRTAAKM